jgi:hypothetical protein
MKLALCGSRSIVPSDILIHELMFPGIHGITEIVSGGATGVDSVAPHIATSNGWKYREFPADWGTHGKAGGPIRNKQIAEYADELLLIWDGQSAGSRSIKNEFLKLRKPIYEFIMIKHN